MSWPAYNYTELGGGLAESFFDFRIVTGNRGRNRQVTCHSTGEDLTLEDQHMKHLMQPIQQVTEAAAPNEFTIYCPGNGQLLFLLQCFVLRH